MKKIMLSAALLLALTSVTAFAQTTDLDAKTSAVTREMSSKLGLNESSYIQLKAINRENLAKIAEIASTYKNDAAMRDAKLAEVQNAYDAQLRNFLNTKQLEAYATYKESKSNFTALEGDKK